MTIRQLKIGYYTLAAINTLATSYFLNYLFFFLRDHFGFGNRQNLWISALHGFIYVFAAWQCGKFAQRRGFHTSLKIGFAGLAIAMIIGGLLRSQPGIFASLICYTITLLFTWPALEALTSENEPPDRVPHMVGIYNCTWSASAAIAYFTGGKLYDSLGAGAVFWIPAGLFLCEFLLTLWLARRAKEIVVSNAEPAEPVPHHPEAMAFQQSVPPETFLKLAWLANPFAYMAVNTLFAVMPGLALKLGLSPTKVGLFCSVWLFGRLAAFVTLWQWTGWHYRFRWMIAGFFVLIGSFLTIVMASQLWLLVVAQIFFGFAAGLAYYASLFYSMDVGEASASHGGLHEAAIGIGVCIGTAVGAASLEFLPNVRNAGTFAVSGLLVVGLAVMIGIWSRARNGRALDSRGS